MRDHEPLDVHRVGATDVSSPCNDASIHGDETSMHIAATPRRVARGDILAIE
jgi:hypothetical protein